MARFKNNFKKNDAVFFIVGILSALFLVLADLLTKQIVIHKIPLYGEKVVIDHFFSFTHIRNSGAAWGIFSSHTEILSYVTILCAILIVYAIYAATVNKTMLFCLASILGGACGNLLERMRLGYVTDFLSFNIFGYHFPHFNFADMCITLGCIFLLLYIIFFHKKEKPLFREGTFLHKIFKE